ncbi:MAG: methane monooxygenase/ammonia monooxygenase subunit C [Pseudomonadota bacterium]|nr:methane monooxygenase/ammonia monooxygenase subunit C [Pseudomonadota bacterium]
MSHTDQLSAASARAARLANPSLKFPWKTLGIPVGMALITLGIYRWYQHNYAFTTGLDYFSPEFQTYWMPLFWTQIIAIPLVGLVGVTYLWFTRESDADPISPQTELARYQATLGATALGSLIILAAVGIWVESDAAWHQVTIRDTDFTPTHIGLFYFGIPAAACAMTMGFVWVHTRLPDFRHRISIPLALVVAAPILIMPNLGFNEWGHTFFYAEELFAAPIHWGFVVLGWGFFGLTGFTVQCLAKMATLTRLQSD